LCVQFDDHFACSQGQRLPCACMVHRIALVRHGQSEFNLNKKFAGWTDVDLTETGRKEAIQVLTCCCDHMQFRTAVTGQCRADYHILTVRPESY